MPGESRNNIKTPDFEKKSIKLSYLKKNTYYYTHIDMISIRSINKFK